MKTKTYLRLFSRMLFLLTLLIPGWQRVSANEVINAGTYDRSVVAPWTFIDVHYDEFKKDEVKRRQWSYNDKDINIWETEYCYESGKKGYGYKADRQSGKDKYTVNFRAMYEYKKVIPPYAKLEAEWKYMFSAEGDKGRSSAHVYLFDDRQTAEKSELWIYPDGKASNSDKDNYEYVDCAWYEDRGDNTYNGRSTKITSTVELAYDNSNSNSSYTYTKYMFNVACFYAKSDDGHVQSTMRTESYQCSVYYPRFKGKGTKESPLQITSGADLYAFATIVNSGVEGTENLYAILTADVDYTNYSTDMAAMIGTSDHPFMGVFDGRGFTIDLSFDYSSTTTMGLFRVVKDATIRNLVLSGTIKVGVEGAALIGGAYNSVTLENVLNRVNIQSDCAGAAGIASMIGAGHTSKIVMTNVGFMGAMNMPKSNQCAGFIGSLDDKGGTSILTNCYFAPSVADVDANGSYTLVRWGNNTYVNTYVTTTIGTAQGTLVSKEKMSSGEICWKLNNSKNDGNPWLQTLGDDDTPQLWGSLRVYEQNGNYFNFKAPFRGAGTELDPFQLESLEHLQQFRDFVNEGHYALCGKLVADIDMANHNWIPITPYYGIFDGNGYVISNLNVQLDESQDNAGLFGYVRLATIKNLVIRNVTLRGNTTSSMNGAIAGYMSDSATVQNCGVCGLVSITGYSNSGIAYNQKNTSVIKDCYTVFGNVNANSSQKGVTNSYAGADVEKYHATGELTYKLNNGSPTPWVQTLDRDAYPLLRGALSVSKNASGYYNSTYTGGDESAYIETTSGKDFRVIHHGGRLFEFVITMATQDGKSVNICPDATISSYYNDSWNKIFAVSDVNADSLSFSVDWWGKMNVICGTMYDTKTYDKQVPTFWIRQGNHTTSKQTSLLWVAPKEWTSMPTKFQFKGTADDSKLNLTANTEATTAPGDDAGLVFIDPIIATTQLQAGSAMTVISANNKSYGFGLWDATDNYFISTQEMPEGVTSIEAYMPQVDCYHDLVALVYTRSINTDNEGNSDTVFVNYSYPMRQQPVHKILKTNISANYNSNNLLEWAIAFPNDTDMLSDQYLLSRGYLPTYTDQGTRVAYNANDTAYTTMENDTLWGWFSFLDTIPVDYASLAKTQDTLSVFDTWNISAAAKAKLGAYKYPARYLYYQAYRPMVTSIWSANAGYKARWKVLQREVLPTVDSVQVIKDADFATNHKVKVRIVLNNPYPWDVVDEADRSEVLLEAQRQLFDHRMFMWDKNALIQVERFSTSDEYDNGKDVILKYLTLSGSQVLQDSATGNFYVEYEDIVSMPFVHYYYKAVVDIKDTHYPICTSRNKHVVSSESIYTEQFGGISNLKATRGTLRGTVNVTWEADECEGSTLTLKRREYKRGFESEQTLAEWSDMTAKGGSASDDKASAAVVNEYVLTITTTYRQHSFTQSDTTYGYASYYGSVNGRVKMSNGVNMPGDVHAIVSGKNPFDLQQITHPKTGEVIMPACHYDLVQFDTPTDDEGMYQLDSIPYYGAGTSYTAYATCEGATFVSPTGSASSIDLTYEDSKYTYSNIDFTCNDTKQFSGRILYTNSTVPVRDVFFKVNGTILRDAKGEPIVTDAMGNFSFMVPRMEVSVQAFRPGHKMSNDGYILGGDDGQQRIFTPTKDYAGLILDDETQVRLVGRVAGGVIQGIKPMGFGAGNNNLGDSITLVLTLEGDHTSYLYFDKKNPDVTSYTKQFTQRVFADMGVEQRIPTQASFEAKRIVVKADNATGEFCVDLFPTKYVVSQIYATGYSTLYGADEGLTILDLTDSVGLHTHSFAGETTEYDGSFRKVYHTPVQVDLLQLRNNQYQSIYGEESLEVTMLSGKQKMQLSWMDADQTAQYAMGNPVYKGGNQYFFMVSAYEPYYYNNITTGAYDRVPMAGYEVTVHNGLTSLDLGADDEEEEEEEEEELVLSMAGTAMFSVIPNNPVFSLVSDYDALRYLSASVDINGYHYESTPIAAYVTGERDYSVEVVDALEGDPQILDYIRDPYGAGSYAYRTAGTSYSWSRSYEAEKQEAFAMDLELGFGIISEVGWMIAMTTEYQVTASGSLEAVSKHEFTYKDGEFTLTLSDQLTTSDDPIDQGAIADIYLGTVSTADVVKYQTFNVVDSSTYQALLPAMETGVARMVAAGQDENGHPCYMVICGGVTWQPGEERVFAYSQRHILNTLIPQLEARRSEALRLVGSADEAVRMAAASGKTFYYMSQDGEYEPVYPSNMKVRKDTVQLLTSQIDAWKKVIAENEKQKYEAMSKPADLKYSLAGTTIEHSEEASTYYRVRTVDGPKPVTGSVGVGSGNGTTDSEREEDELDEDALKCVGFVYSISLGGQFDNSTTNDMSDYTTIDGGSGFVIVAADNNYFDMDVYYQNDESIVKVNDEFKKDINKYEGDGGLDDYKITNETLPMTDDNTYVHNYIFVMRGGATREPWMDADYTQCYFPDGTTSVPLGTRTLKIDKPVLYVENPVVYNQPQDEKAIFTLHLSNESELDGNVKEIYSSMYLHLVDASNPYGAKLSIDGQPLHGDMEFLLNPGESITKTLEVERGGKPYDYENIELELTDNVYFQASPATISVHYLPTSTPVTLTQPAQNFLINTLSQKDDEGKYYIPVQIEGFSTTKYDNFDHIELQYKRQTDGEDQWVNQCSYYTDELLYKLATGNKAMIETEGKITNLRFYGEQDPVEQKYDLRAVSFCRLGNGYTTRTSGVISGTKDTRCPEVFGLPKPADGILDFDDVISLPFTEPIAYNYLDETANFSVQGYTNNSDVDNSVALYFSGSANQKVVSEVDRVLNSMDFSVEMNVQVDEQDMDSVIWLLINDDFSTKFGKHFVFGYMQNTDRLAAAMNGKRVVSKPVKATTGINLCSAMTHVGLVMRAEDSTLTFYVGEQELAMADSCRDTKLECHANGLVNIGMLYKGKMNNLRLWSKALNFYEMTTKYKKQLSANEANLLGYWPLNEAQGEVAYDYANGATLHLTDVSWSLPKGYNSVLMDHQPMEILPNQALKYTRNNREDYTISFYFKVDQLDGDANLFAAGSDGLEEKGNDKVRIRFINGVLYFISEGNQYAFGDDNDWVTDGAWHYLAVSVNHAQNKASLLIDGQLVNQVEAENIGGVAGSSVCYGDKAMVAHIDQVQMWSMALPASYIKQYFNTALSGKEKELQIYLPFEREEMNEQGTMYLTFSPYNHVIVPETGKIAGDTVVDETKIIPDTKIVSPVRNGNGIENLPFTWKSTDNELQITINKSNAQINKQHLSLVVRRVEDLNGNPMQNAQMWTTYVNRNVLNWMTKERALIIPYGRDTTLLCGFTNSSGRTMGYSIDCTNLSITLSPVMGTMLPLSEQTVAVHVSDGLNPGVYQAAINLTDEDGLCSTLTLNIKVEAQEPDWSVTTDPGYTQSMNLIGVVKKQEQGAWILDMCKKDKVAAFIGKECVGVANLTVDAYANTSYLYLTIRGKSNVSGQDIEFRLWDALKGQTYILSAEPNVTFNAQSIVGVDKPIEMRAFEMRVQTIDLAPGWNWISLFVDPFADKGLNNLFSNQKQFTSNDIFCPPFGSTFATYQSNNTWDATLDDMDILKNNVYQIYAQYAAQAEVSGALYDNLTITLDFTKSEWAQMAYLSDKSLPIRQALNDFVAGSEKAPAGTIIKGYEDFAIATADGTWMGSLQYLRPGEGYFVRRNGLRDSLTLTFSNTTTANAIPIPNTNTIPHTITNTMMPLVASFADDDVQEGDILLAMVGNQVIAKGNASDKRFFISLHANHGEVIQFAKVRNGEVVAVTGRGLSYDEQGTAGTVEQPYLIDFSQVEEDAPIYDILGMKYDHLNFATPRVLIQGSHKTLSK